MENCFNAAVGEIFDPSNDAMPRGLLASAFTEENPLDASRYHYMCLNL